MVVPEGDVNFGESTEGSAEAGVVNYSTPARCDRKKIEWFDGNTEAGSAYGGHRVRSMGSEGEPHACFAAA